MYKIITLQKDDDLFPEEFRKIGDDCPNKIYAMGNVSLLREGEKVAVIGSRNVSEEGQKAAYEISRRLAEEDKVIVSGLALGCDTSAHRGCIDANGKTIAIVATGLDNVYPRENTALQEEILQKGGLILSEQPLGKNANRLNLIMRNRLQAALSTTVIVAECPFHSGTMRTVRKALKYRKLILAVKFPFSNKQNSGNTYIIQEGIGKAIDC